MADTKISAATATTTLPQTASYPVAMVGDITARRITHATLRGGVFNVKDYGAKGDGVTDDVLAIQAAITAAVSGGTVYLPPTSTFYAVSDQLLLDGATGVILQGGSATTAIRWIGAAAPTKAIIKLRRCYRCIVENLYLNGSTGNKPGYGVWLTSNGSGVTMENIIRHVRVINVSDTGIKVGAVDNLDTNMDANKIENCSIDSAGIYGVAIDGSNTNLTEVANCTIAYSGTAGIWVGTYTRVVRIVKPFFVENGTAHILVDNKFSSTIHIVDFVCELFTHPLLDAIDQGGGLAGHGHIIIENGVMTCNFASAIKLIDYRQSGALSLRNLSIAGRGDGTPTYISVAPENVSQPGLRTLYVENVHLTAGAAFQVTTTGSAAMRWFGTYGYSATSTDSVTALVTMALGLPVYANNAAAIAGGLAAGALYRTNADPDPVCVVH